VCEHNSEKRIPPILRTAWWPTAAVDGEVSCLGDDIAWVKLRKRWRDESVTPNPNLFCIKRRKDSAPPRVSIVHGFTPASRGGVRHLPAKSPRRKEPTTGYLVSPGDLFSRSYRFTVSHHPLACPSILIHTYHAKLHETPRERGQMGTLTHSS
jgi:hypothetical protein